MPDRVISVPQATQIATRIKNKFDNVNGRLAQLAETIYKEIVDEKSGSVTLQAGRPVATTLHLVDVSVANGAQYDFVLHADGLVGKYAIYGNNTAIKYACDPETVYHLTASADITWFSVYVNAANALGDGQITGVVTQTFINEDSIESQIENIGTDTIDELTNPIELTPNDLEDGAIRNGTGADFVAVHRVRTKTYIQAKKGTIITCSVGMNVWEYDLVTKEYLTDNLDWVYAGTPYTVKNDSCIRIMWNSLYGSADLSYQDLIDGTNFSFLREINNALIDGNFIKELSGSIAAESALKSMPSLVVRSIAHRGDDIEGPQCTTPAYILARKRGFTVAENDLWLSEDGEFVMWHDTNLARLGNMVDINGYLMYTDGTDYYWVHPTTNAVYTWNGSDYVASSVALSSLGRCNGSYYGVNSQYSVIGLPLSVLKRIDFGVYKGAKFAGTQILTFAEWVLLCKQLGMEIYIDRKLTYTDALITQAANIVKRYGMGDYASWLGLNTNQITLLRSIIPDSRCGILQHPTAATAQSYKQYDTGRGFFFNGDAQNGMTEEALRYGLDAGFDVEVWFVGIESLTAEQVYETIRTAVSYGVTGMTLDHYRVDDAFKSLIDSY